jgi:fumarate reductase subunit C
MENLVLNKETKKSRIPAWLDITQSGTGLILGLFMWVHMLLISSILLGTGSFNFIAHMMELSFLSPTGEGYPIAVVIAVSCIFTLFILHAGLGMRKFPSSYKQYKTIRSQMKLLNHEDTNLWFYQVLTGFIMFFTGSVHLYIMLTHPEISPVVSAQRVFDSPMWPLYLVLLIAVEYHGGIGLYRLCMKWGWLTGKDTKKSRAKLKKLKKTLTMFFLVLGILSLIAFFLFGARYKNADNEEKTAKISTTITQQYLKG